MYGGGMYGGGMYGGMSGRGDGGLLDNCFNIVERLVL